MSKLNDFNKKAEKIASEFAGKTPEAREKQLANIQIRQEDSSTKPPAPAENGNLRAYKHGAYSYLRTGIVPGCHLCVFTEECEQFKEESKDCSLILEMQDQLIKNIMALPHVNDEDIVLVEELARSKTFLWVVDKWISRVGPFKEKPLKLNKLEAQGVLKQRWTAANTMTRICDQLGLSPLSRAKLKIEGEGFDFAEAMAQVGDTKDAK